MGGEVSHDDGDRERRGVARKVQDGSRKVNAYGRHESHVGLEISRLNIYEQLTDTIMNGAVVRKLEKDRESDPVDTGMGGGYT